MSMTVGSAVCPTNAMLAPRQARAAAGVESHQRARCMPSGSHLLGGQPRHSVHGGHLQRQRICRSACCLLMLPPDTARKGAAAQICGYLFPNMNLAAAGRSCHVTRTLATGANVAPMVHPPGPSKMYPEENQAIEDYLNELALELLRNEEESQVASASPETTGVIETPPEWGRPDEGNPNQPRRVPEYQPPQVGSKHTHGCGQGPALMQYPWQSQFSSRLAVLSPAQPDLLHHNAVCKTCMLCG